MENLTRPQRLVVENLIEQKTVKPDDVHPSTLKWLIDNDWVTVIEDRVMLATRAEEEIADIEIRVDVDGSESPVSITDNSDDDVTVTADEVMVSQLITLRDPVTIQIDAKGNQVTVPSGVELPVFGYSEEANARRVVKWFTVLFPPTDTLFLVNALHNKVKPISPRPLTSFKV